MDTFACILCDVPGGILSRVAKLYVDDKRIAGDLQPELRQVTFLDPPAFSEHMEVSVPSVVASTTLDLNEENTARLCLTPQHATTQLSKRSIDSIDIFTDRVVGLAERQGDEPEFFAVSKFAHAGSDMSCTFGSTGLTESVSTSVAGDLEHVGIIDGLHDPSTAPTIIETYAAILSLFDRLQRTLNTTTTVSPSGVPECHTAIEERIFRANRRIFNACLRSCFEAIKSIGKRWGTVCHGVGVAHVEHRTVGD